MLCVPMMRNICLDVDWYQHFKISLGSSFPAVTTDNTIRPWEVNVVDLFSCIVYPI